MNTKNKLVIKGTFFILFGGLLSVLNGIEAFNSTVAFNKLILTIGCLAGVVAAFSGWLMLWYVKKDMR